MPHGSTRHKLTLLKLMDALVGQCDCSAGSEERLLGLEQDRLDPGGSWLHWDEEKWDATAWGLLVSMLDARVREMLEVDPTREPRSGRRVVCVMYLSPYGAEESAREVRRIAEERTWPSEDAVETLAPWADGDGNIARGFWALLHVLAVASTKDDRSCDWFPGHLQGTLRWYLAPGTSGEFHSLIASATHRIEHALADRGGVPTWPLPPDSAEGCDEGAVARSEP